MSEILYYYRCSVKNSIIRVLKKPVTLIGYLFFGFIFIVNIFNSTNMEQAGDTFYGEIIYTLLGLALLGFSVLFPIYNGTKTFTLKFLPADGIYMMSGPVKPLKILWYGQFKQSFMGVLVGIFMLIQIPTLKEMVGLNDTGIFLFVVAFILLTLLPNIVCLMTFVLGLRFEILKSIIRGVVILIVVGAFIIVGVELMKDGPFFENLRNGLVSDYWIVIPLVGWIQILIAYSIVGEITGLVVTAFLLIVATVLISILVINRYADDQFYEEALNTAVNYDHMRKQIKSGKSQLEVLKGKRKVKAKAVDHANFRPGVFALLDKQLLLAKKKRLSYIDFQTMLIMVLVIGMMLITSRYEETSDAGFFITLGVLAYALFFMQLLGGFDDDIERHYIYMFPYSAIKKLLALNGISMIKILIECCVSFVIGGIITGNNVLMAFVIGLIAGLAGINFSLISLLAGVVFGKVGTLPLKVFMRIILDIIAVILVGIALGVGTTVFNTVIGLVFAIITLVLLGILVMIPVSLKVNKPEFND